ncbi:hypothetical protein OJAV_G00143600 [Oryzias javanicus]|uniref:Aquaporin n=1 Tax=Oryzias javanicus TaxID=123683 RepID=A0A437CMW3_ORYJA|nr:hypothetical protein OJAV_G00143600 [Oryzias javanicus]
MADLWASVAVLCAAVLLCEALRRAAARVPAGAGRPYLLEAVSTFQLCCCTHELKLLGEMAQPEPALGLTLTYMMTVVHVLTFREATCNPAAALEKVCRGTSTLKAAARVVACQFGAAFAARYFARSVWSLGLSDSHVRHQKFGFRCFDPLGGTLLEAAGAELACAFAFQAVVMHAHKVDEKLRVHVIAGVVTAAVYAAGNLSGAVFNPVLAFSVQFPCSGHSYLEYCFVYWLGPALGMASCILLFEKILPFLSGRNAAEPDRAEVRKQKMQ